MEETHITITTQWPAVVHRCPGSNSVNGFWVVRFGVCRDGEKTTCKYCGRMFVYSKARRANEADAYQWGAAEEREGGHR